MENRAGIAAKKTGATSPLKRFKQLVYKISESDHLPDYRIAFDRDRDMLVVWPRKAPADDMKRSGPILKTQTYVNAQNILGPHGLDKYAIEAEWREWVKQKKELLKTPDGAYIGFCHKKVADLYLQRTQQRKRLF